MISRDKELEFLNSKLRFMNRYVDASIVAALQHLLNKVAASTIAIPRSALNDIDKEFDKILIGHVSPNVVASIRADLIERFGYASFGGVAPDSLILKLLKCGIIDNETEAKVVQDHLSGDYGGYKLSDRRRIRLGKMLNAYEVSRKRS